MIILKAGPVFVTGMSTGKSPILVDGRWELADVETDDRCSHETASPHSATSTLLESHMSQLEAPPEAVVNSSTDFVWASPSPFSEVWASPTRSSSPHSDNASGTSHSDDVYGTSITADVQSLPDDARPTDVYVGRHVGSCMDGHSQNGVWLPPLAASAGPTCSAVPYPMYALHSCDGWSYPQM